MKKSGLILVGLAVGIGLGLWAWFSMAQRESALSVLPPARPAGGAAPTAKIESRRNPGESAVVRVTSASLAAAEKNVRVEKITRDYDEMRAKLSADYSLASASLPNGLNGFLRQLALLERERHADLAAVLNARELEDLEMRETTAGKLVQRLLGDTTAGEDLRRAVFRFQREFDERFALTFDMSPQALYEREMARQALQGGIAGLLGPELFGAWLRGEGGDYANFARFAAQQGLQPATVATELWNAKNELTLGRLKLGAQNGLSAGQVRMGEAALVGQIRERVLGILGPGSMETAGPDVLGWLPMEK